MGGALTILAAVRVPEMDAGACFYGLPDLPDTEFRKSKIPLICHFANQDGWITPPKRTILKPRSSNPISIRDLSLQRPARLHERGSPQVYDAPSAKLAWERTLKFLRMFGVSG